ncbi:MAG TPA: PEFG-CTERM sorting domain-containing protein [Nitrosopumilaceae archaeon]|nr:PEFG-CTERM sorting domain-containing protein [Nitrosopumilaceae archaeon]
MQKLGVICCFVIMISSIVLPAHAEVISFETDKPSYVSGENIRFEGIVQQKDIISDAIITIVINDPEGKFVLVTQAKPDNAGSFYSIIDTVSRFQVNGTYHATAYTSTEDQGSSTNFDLFVTPAVSLSSPSIIKRQQITVGENKIFLNVQSSSMISDFAFDEGNKQISFKVTGDKGTSGVTLVPVSQVLEGPYVVTFDGQVWRDFQTVEDKNSGDTFLRIRYPHSTHEITITGTAVVPEFPVTGLILVASMMTILIITRTKWNGI